MAQAASSPVGTRLTQVPLLSSRSILSENLDFLDPEFFVPVLSSIFCDVDIALEFGFPSLLEAA